MRLSDFTEINPYEKLPKGTIAKKISMEQLEPYKKFVSGYSLEAYSGGAKFRNGDTIMARITPCLENGKTAFVSTLEKNEVGFGSTEYIVFRAKDGISHPDFVYYLVISSLVREPAIKSMVGSSGRQRVQQTVIDELEIPNYSLAEQQHIVDILGSIDEKIENNEQLINIFENLAAKKYLDFANKTSTKTKLEDVIELFDSKRIPLSSREREQRKGIYPYYGATGILDYVNGFLFSGEYVLFAEDGTVTDTNGHPIVQLVNGSFWVNNHAHILKGKNGWNDYTLYVALKQINVDKAVTGAVQPKINQANLLSLEIPNLSNNNLQTINTELDIVFHKVFHLRSENKSLQELKGLYLKKFFE